MDSANPSMTTVSRRSRPKTRTGCLTCKSRRVKCDERKPSCLRCLSTKRICEGYPVVDRPTLAITNQLGDEERRAFSFFRSRTAHRIFGEQDVNDWVPVILQIAHVEPAVRHGITALASLHESLEPVKELTWLRQSPQDRSLSVQMLALRHYNHAIQSLRSESIDMSSRPDITMVLCILFLCFEQFRSGDAACLVHLTAGLKLIDWWRSRTDNYTKLKDYSRPTLEFMNEKITPIIQRLRVQFSLCMDSRHSWRGYGVTSGLPPPAIPATYPSFDAARRDFDRAMNYMFSVLENSQVPCHQKPAPSPISVLHQWKDTLDSSDLSSQATHLQGCSRRLLELYYHVSIVIAGTYHTELETTFDESMDQFRAIVDLAEQIVIDWQHAPKEYSLLFSFDLGITPPMFLVASRCRHSEIRRKAVRLMLESPFYHGVWRDRYTGLCAERIVDIEEAGMESFSDGSTYVPEHCRIRKVSADLQDTKDHIAMKFVRSPFVENSPVYTTMISL
ncbi:hypothetical protein BO78DRAFT_428211 [Aspergillus sclerotiicarbonarius CBS 121057]|uniref:Zn(2)-C6 fungal-type domain-containing protein n=1 Tax=Aspergillus sclerotiicarbonarius (strain CBS 121057 / IBT 28362) TaxID=1448318 RepID=A0A319EL14_ASPSB|nr:hypothetical protein BO78DRAFT_428211 [Aspergillus sclerotiicarbonarius CBS 121057]